MSCELFKTWLQESLDGARAGVPGDMQHHLDGCSECRSWYEASAKLRTGLSLRAAPTPGPGLSSRIVALVLREHLARRRRRRAAWAVLAVAASLICAIVIVLAWRSSMVRDHGNSVVRVPSSIPSSSAVNGSNQASSSGVAKVVSDVLALGLGKAERMRLASAIEALLASLGAQPEPPPASVAEGIEDMGSLFASRLRRTADDGKTLLDIVTPRTPVSTNAGENGNGSGDPTESVQTGLKPVTGSARRAVDLFMRSVPGVDREK
jgi:hypothetical protein